MFTKVHKYLENITPQRPAVMREMEEYAAENDFPIVGPLVGRLLYQLASMTKAKRIFELGSGFGYSAYWFSLAIGSRGHIVLTDGNKDNKKRAMNYFKRAGIDTQLDFKVGDALRTIKKHDGPFDIIFNDIDKKDYPKTIDLAAARLRKGGLFITDNVIWKGKVAEKNPDDTTKAILEFNEELYHDGRFFVTIIPLRDGLAVATRL